MNRIAIRGRAVSRLGSNADGEEECSGNEERNLHLRPILSDGLWSGILKAAFYAFGGVRVDLDLVGAQQCMQRASAGVRGDLCRLLKRHVTFHALGADSNAKNGVSSACAHLMATHAVTRERVGVLLFLVHVVARGTSHLTGGETFAQLQRTDLVAMHIWRRIG